jgi:hypothetical protein
MEAQDGCDTQDAEAEAQCTQQMHAADEPQIACTVRADGSNGTSDPFVRGQAVGRQRIAHAGIERRRHRARFRAIAMALPGCN